MDEEWDLEGGDVWGGVVEHDRFGFSGAVRFSLGVVLIAGIAIGFAVGRISGGGSVTGADGITDSADPAESVSAATVVVDSGAEAVSGNSGTIGVASGISVGPSLAIGDRSAIGEMWPVGILESDGGYVLYGSDEPGFGDGKGSGVEAWTSGDGSSWSAVGQVVAAPAAFHAVVETSQGIMAVGSNGPGNPTLFRSDDGLSWTATALPTDVAGEARRNLTAITVGVNDNAIVVFGTAQHNPQSDIIDLIPAEFRPNESNGLSLGMSSPPFTVQVQAPLGITVFSATAEELGLDDDVIASIMGGPWGADSTTVWRSTDGTDWSVSELDDLQATSLSTNPDGDFVASGYSFRGEVTRRSSDGITWETTENSSRVQMSVSGLNGAIGVTHGMRTSLAYSRDGNNWESVHLDELLDGGLEWNFHPLAAGAAGVAAIATSYDASSMRMEPEPVKASKDGYLLTIDQMRAALTIDKADVEVFRMFLHSGEVSDKITVHTETRSITFLDSDTREPLVTFTFEELRTAGQETYQDFGPTESRQVLLFSPDGTTWSAAELDTNEPFAISASSIHVGNDTLLVVLTQFEPTFSDQPAAPSVAALLAAIP